MEQVPQAEPSDSPETQTPAPPEQHDENRRATRGPACRAAPARRRLRHPYADEARHLVSAPPHPHPPRGFPMPRLDGQRSRCRPVVADAGPAAGGLPPPASAVLGTSALSDPPSAPTRAGRAPRGLRRRRRHPGHSALRSRAFTGYPSELSAPRPCTRVNRTPVPSPRPLGEGPNGAHGRGHPKPGHPPRNAARARGRATGRSGPRPAPAHPTQDTGPVSSRSTAPLAPPRLSGRPTGVAGFRARQAIGRPSNPGFTPRAVTGAQWPAHGRPVRSGRAGTAVPPRGAASPGCAPVLRDEGVRR